jgi:multiple sugar transport system substrate-binding protein
MYSSADPCPDEVISSNTGRLHFRPRLLLATLLTLFASACEKPPAVGGRTTITLWRHQANEAEELASRAAIERFNSGQGRWLIKVQSIPQQSYSQSLMAASMAGNLPCILEVDQPMVPTFVWAGHLRPLKGLVAHSMPEEINPVAIGRFREQIYSVGQFEGTLAIYARRSDLEAVHARIPTVERPWTRAEFDQLLADLKATGRFAYPLDLSTRDLKTDWWTYAFSPMLQSFGGDLIDRRDMVRAEGALNGPSAIAFASWFQGLFQKGYANRSEPDERAFQKHRVALSYNGNWWAQDFSDAAGKDLVILPPPDLGRGAVSGGGSWQWAISSTCNHPQGAAAFINFLMTPKEVAATSNATGMIPTTSAGAALTSEFASGGSKRVFYDISRAYARQRPATPAFAAISNAWFRAMRDVMNGEQAHDALDDAVDAIERNIKDNNQYRFPASNGRKS